MCQCVRAEGALGQGENHCSGRTREKQTGHLSFSESTPNQPDRLGMESPFSGESELS